MMKTIIKQYLAVGLSMVAVFSACKKDNEGSGGGGNGYMQMEMTDAPGDYIHVYVDIKSVQVHRNSDSNNEDGWITLNTRDTIYDLLLLQNNLTTILVDSTQLPVGGITQMRLILGTNNFVVLKSDSSIHPLIIPSSQNTGIKVLLNAMIQPNRTTRILIDFDADKSINLLGNGEYQMKPVIQVKSVKIE